MGVKVFASAANYKAVTPSDSNTLNFKALYVGNTGDVAIAPSSGGSAVTFENVPDGAYLLIEGRDARVMSTNTTATGIVALEW